MMFLGMRSSTRRLPLPAFAAAFLGTLPLALPAQGLKEGVATFLTRTTSGKTDTVVQMSKGRDLRLEGFGGGNQSSVIVDGDGKRIIVLEEGSKKAMVMTQRDAKQMEEMAESMGVDADRLRDENVTKPTITKTGRTESVGGVKCEVFHVTTTHKGQTDEGDACIADGIGFGVFDALTSTPFAKRARAEFDRYRSIVGPGKGLVKATTMRDGRPLTLLELVKFEPRDLPASSFDVPAGYEVQEMGDMMDKARQALDQLKRKKP